ncbi:hypothetical protein GGS23DRAFT_470600 [Durotheca rogersii]|uniref:uncharacterized protein n=1 Tax=Durotheca rogersii TaxID=419775 RepID=UPI00221EBED1|nr:uncharacterized protein GGS23DRAFT_470600 [Durotheca rogersii]KAI5855028.1 hypothetical protein GGS23DRAFT_470600 [Durotheca rogersii]
MDSFTVPGLDLCMYPAGAPPPGTVSNFENPDTLVAVLMSICILMTVLSVIFTACRLFANRRKLWWSDYFATTALILLLAQTGLMLAQTRFARHQWDVRACWYDGTYTKILFAQQIIVSFVLFFSKASIFLLFYQVFDVKQAMRMAIRVGIVFSGLIYFTNIPTSAVLSAPHVGETWASVLLSGRPERDLIWGVVQSALGIILDLFIFFLPVPVIMSLNLSTKKKIQILAVFTTAAVGVVASVLSLVYRVEALDTNDGTWKYTSLLICSVVENHVAIIVSCTPGFANFTRVYVSQLWIVKSLRSTLGGSGSGRSGIISRLSMQNKEDPNRPRTGRGFGKKAKGGFGALGDTSILQSVVSTAEGGDGSILLPLASHSPQIVRIVNISHETHRPGPTPAAGVAEPQIQSYPPGTFYYGPGAAEPPTQSVWFYYVPSANEQVERPSHDPGTYPSWHSPSQSSAERLVVQRPGEA